MTSLHVLHSLELAFQLGSMQIIKSSMMLVVILTFQLMATLVQTSPLHAQKSRLKWMSLIPTPPFYLAPTSTPSTMLPVPVIHLKTTSEPSSTMETKAVDMLTDQSKTVDMKTDSQSTKFPDKTSENPKSPFLPMSTSTSIPFVHTTNSERTTVDMLSKFSNDVTTPTTMMTYLMSDKPSTTQLPFFSKESTKGVMTSTSSEVSTKQVMTSMSSEGSTKEVMTSTSSDGSTKEVMTSKISEGSTKEIMTTKSSSSSYSSKVPTPTKSVTPMLTTPNTLHKVSLEEILEMFKSIENEKYFQRLPLKDRLTIYELATGIQSHKIKEVLEHIGFERLLTLLYNLPMKYIEQMIAFLLQGLKAERELHTRS